MVDTPPLEEIARRKIKGHVESYIMETGREDSLNRVVGSLVKGHSAEEVHAVFEDYGPSWQTNPDADLEKLDEVKGAVSREFGGIDL